MNRTTWLQDRRMLMFQDVLSRWEQGELSMLEAGELLGMSEWQFRRYRDRYEEDRGRRNPVGFPTLPRYPANSSRERNFILPGAAAVTSGSDLLGDDIGGQLVLDHPDPVPQLQLALLKALDLQYVGPGHVMQGLDGDIQVPVLLAQPRQSGFELPSFLVAHGGGGVGGRRFLDAGSRFRAGYHVSAWTALRLSWNQE